MKVRICEGYAGCACECSRVPPKDIGDVCSLKECEIFEYMCDGGVYKLKSDGLYKLNIIDGKIVNEYRAIGFDGSDAGRRCGVVQ